jgi:hypothetical protein
MSASLKLKSIALLSVPFILISSHAFATKAGPATRELLGYQLGMSIDDAQAVAKAAGGALNVSMYQNGKTNFPVSATVAVPSEQENSFITLVFSPPPMTPQVVQITRTSNFRKGGTTVDNMTSALNAKYGESVFSSSTYREWAWTAPGRSAKVAAKAFSCQPPAIAGYKRSLNFAGMTAWLTSMTDAGWTSCATAGFSAGGDGVVHSYNVSIFETEYEAKALTRLISDVNDAQAAKKKETLDEAAAQKPSL